MWINEDEKAMQRWWHFSLFTNQFTKHEPIVMICPLNHGCNVQHDLKPLYAMFGPNCVVSCGYPSPQEPTGGPLSLSLSPCREQSEIKGYSLPSYQIVNHSMNFCNLRASANHKK
jgi:hypothetical protein